MTSLKRSPLTPATVIRLAETECGSHDQAKLARVQHQLLELAEKPGPPQLVLDMSSVRYFGARFIATLVSTAKQLRKRDRQLALCGLTPLCRELVEKLELRRLFEIYPTLGVAPEAIELQVDWTIDRNAWLKKQSDRWYDSQPVPCLQCAGVC